MNHPRQRQCQVLIARGPGALLHGCGMDLRRLLRSLRAELIPALGTPSPENAALPSLIAKPDNPGCAKPVTGRLAPSAYPFNLVGTLSLLTMAAASIGQVTAVPLSRWEQIVPMSALRLTAKGTATVTKEEWVARSTTLISPQLIQAAGPTLMLGIDRLGSSLGASTNRSGHAVSAIATSGKNSATPQPIASSRDSLPRPYPIRVHPHRLFSPR